MNCGSIVKLKHTFSLFQESLDKLYLNFLKVVLLRLLLFERVKLKGNQFLIQALPTRNQ